MKETTYREMINQLYYKAIDDIIDIHDKIVQENGQPPMVVFPKNPERETDLYDVPIREFKTIVDGYSFKLSAIGAQNTIADNVKHYYIRTFSTKTHKYKRIPIGYLDKLLVFEFADHLKKHYLFSQKG